MNIVNHKQSGLGVIEVLASLVILSAGLLSVGVLQVGMIDNSNDNKAKNEALIIAQSRIEELRNYSDTVNNEDEFDTEYADMTKGNSTAITGVNAAFTRVESIADANSVKEVTVFVTWSDSGNSTQEVSINSSIGWQKPRSVGDVISEDAETLIPSATGRARLGEGTVDTTDLGIIKTPTGDGLVVYTNIDHNSRLGDEDGNIVLTLVDACDTSNSICSDFVRISGRIYIDTQTQGSLDPADVFVKASDAAYCQQYYYDNSNDLKVVDSSTTSAMQSANGDYKYYNYTCYLGGGWHGNIGLILSGGIGQKDKVCQGDPTSADAFADPVISARRVYRGMIYKDDGSGNPVVDTDGDTVYYSIGVADALELPESGDAGHDFVISELGISDTTGDRCKGEVMIRPDSKFDPDGVLSSTPGKLFEGIPTSFYCLNQNTAYVDNFDSSYLMDSSCPFDPSDPPSERHIITGRVLVNTEQDIDTEVGEIYVNTSDGIGNCKTGTFTKPSSSQYHISYTCDVYDWGSGWDGYIQLNTDYTIMSCTDYRATYNGITSDFTAGDNICNLGGVFTASGSVTPKGNKVLAQGSVVTNDANGQCQVAADGKSYSCNSDTISSGSQWTGRLSFSGPGGTKVCIDDPVLTEGTFVISDKSSTATIDLIAVEEGNFNVPVHLIGNSGECP